MNKILSKLSLSKKLIAMGLTFTIPIAVLLFYVISGYNNNIKLAKVELTGNSIIKEISSLIPLLYDHQILVNNSILNGTPEKNLKQNEKQIENRFANLFKIIKQNEGVIGLDSITLSKENNESFDYISLLNRWEKIKYSKKNFSVVINKRNHDILINLLGEYIKLVSDKSYLILDPDLDSYYVMYTIVNTMPKLYNYVYLIENLGAPDVDNIDQRMTTNEQIQFYNLVLQNEVFKKINKYLGTAIISDDEYYGESELLQHTLKDFLPKFNLSIDEYNKSIEILGNEGWTENSRVVKSKLIESSNILWMNLGESLDQLILRRIEFYQNSRLFALLIICSTLGIAIFIVSLIIKSVTLPLKKVTNMAELITKGYITQATFLLNKGNEESVEETKDEIELLLRTVNKMTEYLNNVIKEVKGSKILIDDSSKKINSEIKQLETISTEQVASTSQINVTAKQISESSDNFVLSMNEVKNMVTETVNLTAKGINNIKEINNITSALLTSSAQISEKLNNLSYNSNQINNIITTITKVADQINLLSLNTSLEAEKAGKYGAGFSVLAKEMKRLSDQTAVGTLNIEQIIQNMHGAIEESVEFVERYFKSIKESSNRITELSENFGIVFDRINDLEPNFMFLSDELNAQSSNARMISEGITQLNDSAKIIKAAVTEFNDIIVNLNKSVETFNKEIENFN